MNRRDLIILFGLEVIAIAWAGASFALVPSRVWAGALAGTYFVGFESVMFLRISRWRGGKWSTLTYPVLAANLFFVALPMVITRFASWEKPFDQIHIWGLDGPSFHKLSTWAFGALMGATLWDLARTAGWRRREPESPRSSITPG